MENETVSKNFIEQIIEKDLADENIKRSVLVPQARAQRIPSYIGHAKSILEIMDFVRKVITANSTCVSIYYPTLTEKVEFLGAHQG